MTKKPCRGCGVEIETRRRTTCKTCWQVETVKYWGEEKGFSMSKIGMYELGDG